MRPFLICVFFVGTQANGNEPTYWQDIRPILRKHCTVCHSTKNLKELDVSGGLTLDSYEAIQKGTKRPLIVSGKSGESILVQMLRVDDDAKRMPKDALPLEPAKIDVITRWIDGGAKEGVRPTTLATTAATAAPKKLRRLDVVLTTNAIPPKDVLAPGVPGKLELVLKAGPLPPVTAVAFSPDGRFLASGAYGQVSIWDLSAGQPAKSLTNVLGAVNDVRFSSDGKTLAVAGGQPSSKGEIRLFNTSDWSLLGTLGSHDDVVFSVAFRPDGKQIASASFDKTVRTWDLATRKPVHVMSTHSDFVYSVAFGPDGQWLVSASKDRSVKVFDTGTGKSKMTFTGMDQDVLAIAVAPDGKNIVSSGFEPAIHWWSLETGQRSKLVRGHGVAVHELAFSKDGQLVASAGADGTVRLWNGSSGAAIKNLAVGSVVYSLAISPDGKRIATGSFDGFTRLWDAGSGRILSTLLNLPPDGDKLRWLALTPEGFTSVAEEVKTQAIWRMKGQPVAAESPWKALHKPEAVRQALNGQKPGSPMFAK